MNGDKAIYNKVFKPKSGGLINPLDYYKEAKRVIYGNTDYPTKARKVLEKFGDQPITKITLQRFPVPEYLLQILNVVSLGDFKKRIKEAKYDKLFHLAVVFDTPKGRVLVEKNEVINISETIPNVEGKEEREIPINGATTLRQLLDNTEAKVGKDTFFKYSIDNNNCQMFILNILKANGIGNEADYNWVKQDTEQLFESNPYLKNASDSVIGLASRITGRGKVGGLVVKANPYNAW